MADENTAPDPNIDKLAARLNDGVKACRSMVSNYKALLEADQKELEPAADADEPTSAQP